uniref:(northern house mosquito) hypothetical protein n=1 Tax=Culex pipiens TaxID=7175 RepID=A0A8D8GP33_CULPI
MSTSTRRCASFGKPKKCLRPRYSLPTRSALLTSSTQPPGATTRADSWFGSPSTTPSRHWATRSVRHSEGCMRWSGSSSRIRRSSKPTTTSCPSTSNWDTWSSSRNPKSTSTPASASICLTTQSRRRTVQQRSCVSSSMARAEPVLACR